MAIYQSKNKTRDGRSWFFRIKYTNVYGKKIDHTSPKYKLKREAEEAEAKYRLSLRLETKSQTNSKTFNELFDEYQELMKKELKPQSLKRNENLYKHLKPIVGNIKVEKLTANLYLTMQNELTKENIQIPYINRILGLLNRLINYSLKFYGIGNNVPKVCGNLKNNSVSKKEMLFFTYEEYKQFDSVISDKLWHTFFELLYFMGTRQGEATALNWNDINFSKGELSINKTLTTKIKGEKWTISMPKTKSSTRILPVPEKLLEDLKTIKLNYMNYKGFSEDWFVFGGIKPLPETTIQKKKNNICKKANVKQIRIHDFRHSCASLLINQGASIALVSKYLGHANISITLNTYTHMYESELKNMTEIINNLK